MYNQYNLEATGLFETLQTFKEFLHAEKISKGTARSYLSDIRHFFSWLKEFSEHHRTEIWKLDFAGLLSQVNENLLEAYKKSLLANNVPAKTVNRRFSSLRRFGSFCQAQNIISLNPFDTLRNISSEQETGQKKSPLAGFHLFLWQNKASKSTIKNYLNDVRQFLEWQEREKTNNQNPVTNSIVN